MFIDLIVGARPNFMKIASLIPALEKNKINYRLVHTGQHYDKQMSQQFFDQLNIPKPDINLECGSGSQARQTANIMIAYENLLVDKPSKLCIVVGDVNSTMACSIVAKKLLIPVAHIEAGIRSSDMEMPEEINRIVTDSISDWFFTTSRSAAKNLKSIGVEKDKIFFVGNTMIDTLLSNLSRLKKPKFWNKLKLNSNNYIVLTLHRPSNVDKSIIFTKIIKSICQNTNNIPLIFPIHPRSKKSLKNIEDISKNLFLVEPQPYLEFNYLVKNSLAVITDSGGITEETTVLGIPCITIRDTTERPETVELGTNELVGINAEQIKLTLNRLMNNKWKKGSIPEKWDGKSCERIVKILQKII